MKRKIGITMIILTAYIFIMMSITAFASSASYAKDSVVLIALYDDQGESMGWGSGFAIGIPEKPVQYIVTNCHVAEPRDEYGDAIPCKVKVFFSAVANKYMDAEVCWNSESKDLAVLKLSEPTTERKAIVLCPMKDVDMDDTFVALGYPAASMTADFVKFDKSDISVTRGGISKQVRINETDCYLLDLNISEGNSGGPIVNSKGEVVGISSFYIINKTGDSDGAYVKSNYAIVIDELIRNIDKNAIPYTLHGEITQWNPLYLGAGAGAVVIILFIVFAILISKKRKPGPAILESPQPNIPIKSAVPVNKSEIIGLSGPLRNRRFRINGKIIIGRDPGRCEVAFPLDTPGVSGVHCEVIANNGVIYLKDLNSTYGTFLANGTKLNANTPVRINIGERFYLGGENNKFEVR